MGGVVVVDKPAGWTSHDVVAKVRRFAGTRRVGHAGTLDPMATGVLVLGVERATRLLGHLSLTRKAYAATIRLGQATVTDDAAGEVVATTRADRVDDGAIRAAVGELTGELDQVPSSVSAVKVAGKRAYRRVRGGEEVELVPRRVQVFAFEVRGISRRETLVDVDVRVECSSGTYVRALARDLGGALGVGGHLTMLRRTVVGPYSLADARTIDQLAQEFAVTPIADVAARTFPRLDVDEETARLVSHGQRLRLPSTGTGSDPVALFGPGNRFLALYENGGDAAEPARAVAVFTG